MKTINLFLAMAVTFTAYAQRGVSTMDRRLMPRWQEEAIIMDVLHGDRCDSIKNIQAAVIENLNNQIYLQGEQVVKLKQVDSLRTIELKSYSFTVANQDTLIRYWKRQDIKHKRQRNLAVAVVVVVEVLKFIFTGKIF